MFVSSADCGSITHADLHCMTKVVQRLGQITGTFCRQRSEHLLFCKETRESRCSIASDALKVTLQICRKKQLISSLRDSIVLHNNPLPISTCSNISTRASRGGLCISAFGVPHQMPTFAKLFANISSVHERLRVSRMLPAENTLVVKQRCCASTIKCRCRNISSHIIVEVGSCWCSAWALLHNEGFKEDSEKHWR
jgi:hypothetical protein